jgi:predicted transcriptional regulator
MISQDNNGEKNTPSPKIESQTNLEILVNVLDLLSINPSTLNEIASKKRMPNKNMNTYLGFLLHQGLINKTNQGKKLTAIFSLTQRGITALRSFSPLEKTSHIEFESEEKKWAISKLVVRN